MTRFTANISFLFTERPFLERLDAAKQAGFDHVECHFPYDVPVEVLRERLLAAGVRLTGLNTDAGDRSRGEAGFAGVPGREDRFRRDFAQALDYATALGTPLIHVMAGTVAPNDRVTARQTYIRNLKAAAAEAARSGITLLLEPLNTRDAPGYLVSRSDEVAGIIDEIGEANVKLLFDVYHVQIMEGDLITRLRKHRDLIGHVQVAGVPDRSEPDDRNEVNYSAILGQLDDMGYAGLVGLEYKPKGRTEDGIGRLTFLSPRCKLRHGHQGGGKNNC
jgi:2-dehydrotetronate isomerase